MFKDSDNLVLMESTAVGVDRHQIDIKVTAKGIVAFIARKNTSQRDEDEGFVVMNLSESQAKALGEKLIQAASFRSTQKLQFPPGTR